MAKLPASTTKHYAKLTFRTMMTHGVYESTFTEPVTGTILSCSFDADEWGVNISYVTACMLPVSVFHRVQKNWNY